MNNIQNAMRLAKMANIPVILWGMPGVGKTSAVHHLARRLGLPVVTVVCSIRESTDFIGIPKPVNERCFRYLAAEWVERVAGTNAILLFDDIVTADTTQTNALLRVILERVVGEVELGPGVYPAATANPPSVVAGFPLSPAMTARFCSLSVEVNNEYTQEWVENFPAFWGAPPAIPGVDESVWVQARALVASFIGRRRELLFQFRESDGSKPFPTPRTWDYASRLLAAAGLRFQTDGLFQAIAGVVGEPAAIEFITWGRDMDLPSPQEVLADPTKVLKRLAGRGDKVYAAIMAAISWATGRTMSQLEWRQCNELLAAAARMGQLDLAVPAAVRVCNYYYDRLGQYDPPNVEPYRAALVAAGVLGSGVLK